MRRKANGRRETPTDDAVRADDRARVTDGGHTSDEGRTPGETDGELLHETTHRTGLLAETVARAIATVAGTDPSELEPLYESVDPEALENLFDCDHGRWPGSVEFCHAGYTVVIEGEWVGIHATE
jgi:hypothetical protein